MTNPSLTLGDLSSKIRHVETVIFPHTSAKLSIRFVDGIWFARLSVFDPSTGNGRTFENFGLWLDVAVNALFNRVATLTTKDLLL